MIALQKNNELINSGEERLNEFNLNWNDLCDRIGITFNMDSGKIMWLREKKVARLIAAIPYLAGCNKPRQTAAAHLSVYLLSVFEATKSIFHHEAWNDDISLMNRLMPIGNFEGGDSLLIKRGMNLLALNMVCGYERDIQKDIILKKYNPVGEGSWDYKKLKMNLIEHIENVSSPEMDTIMNIGDGTDSYWGM